MTTDKDRAEFEEVVREIHGHLSLLVRDDGKYANLYTQSMFDLWCLARSRSGAVPAATDAKPRMPGHPIQPLYKCPVDGRLRFKPNALVQHLLDNGGLDMNALARVECSRDDRQHFAQLIGYSHQGYGTLSYASDRVYDKSLERYEKRQALAAAPEPHHGDAPVSWQVRERCLASWMECDDIEQFTRLAADPRYESRVLYAAPVSDPADAREGDAATPIPTPDEARKDWGVAVFAGGVDLLVLRGDGSYHGLADIADYANTVRLAARHLDSFIGAEGSTGFFPECSGDPACCPENEGYGCCKPNPATDARDGGIAALRAFANDVIAEHVQFDPAIQELAEQHGLLAQVTVTESCGDNCECAEVGFPTECYRKTAILMPADSAQGATGGES